MVAVYDWSDAPPQFRALSPYGVGEDFVLVGEEKDEALVTALAIVLAEVSYEVIRTERPGVNSRMPCPVWIAITASV